MKMISYEQHGYDLVMTKETLRKQSILALCQRLQSAAIKCDDYHVFVSYAPHVDSLTVYVERMDTDYTNPERAIDRIVDRVVYLDMDGSIDELTATIDHLQRLGIDV